MKTSPNGRALIERFEGLILSAYDDYNDHVVKPGMAVKGTLTIGYGHTSVAGPPRVVAGQTITKAQADQILGSDLSSVEVEVTNLVKVPLNQNQFDALVSFQFNTGALARSSALRLLNSRDYAGAANALTLYNRGNGKVLQGLVDRREAEKKLFMTKPSVIGPTTGLVAATGFMTWLDWKLGVAVGIACLIGLGIYLYKRNKNVNLVK